MSTFSSPQASAKAMIKKRHLMSWKQAGLRAFQFTCVSMFGFGIVILALVEPSLLGWATLAFLMGVGLVAFVRYSDPL